MTVDGPQAMEVAENVEGLLLAVKATNDFESDMEQRFGGGPESSVSDVRVVLLLCFVHCVVSFLCML